MISPATQRSTPQISPSVCSQGASEWQPVYGGQFWLAYAANFLTCVATNTLVRYADFVHHLGGTAWHLGWIVGVGTLGSLCGRFVLGRAIDQHGAKTIWLGSLLVFAASCFAHLWVQSPSGLGIYFWRLIFSLAIAGIFGASTTFISQGAAPARMAELIGMLGTSGFLGVIVGSQLGDWIVVGWGKVEAIFWAGGLLALGAAAFAWAATAGTTHETRPLQVPTWRVLKSFAHPSFLILGISMGVGLGLPPVFLPAMASGMGISRVGLFFAVYAPVAVLTRFWTRGIFARTDLRILATASMVLLAVAHWSFILVRAEWMLVIPGLIFGVAHAILYPSVVALGATRFPPRYRGLGTSLMLAASDVGVVLGAPLASTVLAVAARLGLSAYPTMLLCVGSTLCVLTLLGGAFAPPPRRHFRGSNGQLITVAAGKEGSTFEHGADTTSREVLKPGQPPSSKKPGKARAVRIP
jgi:MFS family permease